MHILPGLFWEFDIAEIPEIEAIHKMWQIQPQYDYIKDNIPTAFINRLTNDPLLKQMRQDFDGPTDFIEAKYENPSKWMSSISDMMDINRYKIPNSELWNQKWKEWNGNQSKMPEEFQIRLCKYSVGALPEFQIYCKSQIQSLLSEPDTEVPFFYLEQLYLPKNGLVEFQKKHTYAGYYIILFQGSGNYNYIHPFEVSNEKAAQSTEWSTGNLLTERHKRNVSVSSNDGILYHISGEEGHKFLQGLMSNNNKDLMTLMMWIPSQVANVLKAKCKKRH